MGDILKIRNMKKTLPLLFAALCLSSILFAQEKISWKKHKKLADKLFETNQYTDAATHYEQAWQLHSKDKELIYKAGECYYLVKNFKKAIQSFKHVKDENNRYQLVGLKYARALKQDGQYKEAMDAFVYFINAYKGDDRMTVENIVATEVKGCELGLSMLENQVETDIEIKYLGERVNSPAIEFAPIPYTDDLLYFSSTMKNNQAFLFRTQRKNGEWQQSVIAEGLPTFPDKHFANGSFAPGAKRFYFTLCDNGGDGLSTKCEIYVLKREKNKWSAPLRLRDYINIDNATTTTQPWVVHKNGQEILYFSSDRTGGFGGMDIWYSTRNIDSDDIDFTYPVNAGAAINTLGDEITPFYDLKKGELYFSSNGKVSLGGWDVYKTKGDFNNWEEVENLGAPINTSADEFYYVLKPSRKGGFFASNRLHGIEKISTQDEDIFEFGKKVKNMGLFAIGQVMDAEKMAPLDKVRISLYELVDGKEKLLSSKIIAQSNYRFQIMPEKTLRLVAEKKGYIKNTFDFNSYNTNNAIDYTHIFSLKPQAVNNQMLVNQRVKEERKTPAPSYSASANEVDESIITSNNKVLARTNNAQRNQSNNSVPARRANPKKIASKYPSGIYYKVQLIAVNYHSITHPRYQKVKGIGRIETEQLAGKNITRVLIADFPNRGEAEKIKNQVIGKGFLDAFVVKYKDGKRVGRVW
jgi:hypothetical protein